MNNNCTKDIAVICDFDGTISAQDVNTALFNEYGNEMTKAAYTNYHNNKIGLREYLYKGFETSRIDENTFKNFVLNEMKIDPTFFEMCDFAKQEGILVTIVSGGFINYIKILYEKHGRILNIPIVSNRLEVQNDIMLPCYNKTPNCSKSYGPCGICKCQYILEYKEKYKVIYVGDGLTDRCAAENADVVFAKDDLEVFCIKSNIRYIPYTSFENIKDYIINNELTSKINNNDIAQTI